MITKAPRKHSESKVAWAPYSLCISSANSKNLSVRIVTSALYLSTSEGLYIEIVKPNKRATDTAA
jgi:hypothetical protein